MDIGVLFKYVIKKTSVGNTIAAKCLAGQLYPISNNIEIKGTQSLYTGQFFCNPLSLTRKGIFYL